MRVSLVPQVAVKEEGNVGGFQMPEITLKEERRVLCERRLEG